MSDPKTTANDPEQQQTAGDETERLNRVEARLDEQGSKLDAILGKLSGVIPSSHADAQRRQEDKLDRPSSVAEEVRAELARARQEEADAQAAQSAADAEKADREDTKTRLARLEEARPLPPARRSTKLLGWGDGRS